MANGLWWGLLLEDLYLYAEPASSTCLQTIMNHVIITNAERKMIIEPI